MIFIDMEEQVWDVEVSSSLGCSDHEIAKREILNTVRKENSRGQTLVFRRSGQKQIGGIPGETALKDKVAQECWQAPSTRVVHSSSYEDK